MKAFLNSRMLLVFVFIICFLRHFFQIFWSFQRHSFYLALELDEVKIYPRVIIFVSDIQKTYYLIHSSNIFLMGKDQIL